MAARVWLGGFLVVVSRKTPCAGYGAGVTLAELDMYPRLKEMEARLEQANQQAEEAETRLSMAQVELLRQRASTTEALDKTNTDNQMQLANALAEARASAAADAKAASAAQEEQQQERQAALEVRSCWLPSSPQESW